MSKLFAAVLFAAFATVTAPGQASSGATRSDDIAWTLSAALQSIPEAVWQFGLWTALAALLALAAVYRRRADQKVTDPTALLPAAELELPLWVPQEAPVRIAPRVVPARTENLPQRQETQAPTERDPEQTPDFYRDVARLLQTALEHDPKRTDLRHKLLEVYYAIRAKEEFREQTRHYLEQLQGRADQYWHSIVCMGRDLLPESSLYTDTPQVMARTVVQILPVAPAVPVREPTFQRYYEAVNQAKLSARQAELERAWDSQSCDPLFQRAFAELLGRCLQRPTPLQQVERLGAEFGGARVYRKYEDQRNQDDIPMINAIGQTLLASRMGKSRVVAASINGTHGAAVAHAAQQLGLECAIYMKESDQNRNPGRVRRMHDLGASVVTVQPSMFASSDDVRIRALEDWMQDGDATLYINSVDAGPYPYPTIVLYFQTLVGCEARAQMLAKTGRLPDVAITSTADGLSAIGLMRSFFADKSVALYCVESAIAGDGRQAGGHSFRREHSWLRASGRVSYVDVAAAEVRQAIADAGKFQSWAVDAAGGEVLAQVRRLAVDLAADKTILLLLPKPSHAAVTPAQVSAGPEATILHSDAA